MNLNEVCLLNFLKSPVNFENLNILLQKLNIQQSENNAIESLKVNDKSIKLYE